MNTGGFCIHFNLEVFFITKERENWINEQIRAKEMMVIGPNGEQLGIKSKQDALTLAKYAGFDLVLMSENANPAVCKIMDYNKFKYEKKKKAKDALKKQREAIVDIKEFRLSISIDVHDFNTRVKNARKNLEKGAKIKASIKFKGRQISHPELAKDVLNRFSNELSDIADVEMEPKLEGRSMYMQLTPKK
ncbi:MAG: translation initiation factor IF-3 [Bacilli bacterium]|nr:translation initiation factor IF-3 [Bacilli bacterium]